jgi:predicted AlkP superfamily phosphohydrolase/phosphomutase
MPGVYSRALTAEPIWETATRHGLNACLVKFPVSYPSTTASLRIDGAAGWGGLVCLSDAAIAGTTEWPGQEIDHSPPVDWTGSPPSQFRLERSGQFSLPNLWGRRPLMFSFALGRLEDVLVLALGAKPQWCPSTTLLRNGDWTEPIIVEAEGRRQVEKHALRFKLLSLQDTPPAFRLFNTSAHALDGHSSPPAIWQRHREQCGPIEEQTDPDPLFRGAIDFRTFSERCRLNVNWLIRAAQSILTREKWDLFMIQAHFVDWAHHVLQGWIDGRHPRCDPARTEEALNALRELYGMADELVAAVVESAGPGANVVVLGDHGQDLHHTTVRFNEWLAAEGLLVFLNGETIDWSRTAVCAFGNSLYFNGVDRPGGLVRLADFEDMAVDLSRRLINLIDPRTGDRPVLIAGPRAHFNSLGAGGDAMGDIVFCLASGYQARNDRGPLFQVTEPGKEFTSGHDHFWPLDPRLHSRLFAAGPLIAQRTTCGATHSVIDVAPTLATLLGIPSPAHSEGRAMTELIATGVPDAVPAGRFPI